MKFANPKAAAAYAAQATTPKPKPSIGGPRQAVIPKPNLPIRGVGPNDGGPKPMPSTGGPRQVIAPRLAPPTPQPVVGKKDAFYSSPEYKGFQKDSAGKPATMDMYDSPYFGSVGSGSVGRAQDAAYRKYKGIAEPTPDGGPVGTSPAPFGGGGGYAAGPGSVRGLGSAMSGPKVGLNTAMGMNKMAGAAAGLGKAFGMKSGGAVKAPAKKMASGGKVSSASRRGDGIAQRGKTRA